MDRENAQLIASLLSRDEWKRIPSEIAKKLQANVVSKVENLLTSKAKLDRDRTQAERSLADYRIKYEAIATEHDELSVKVDTLTSTVNELETQLSQSVAEITKLQNACSSLESEAADYRHQRNMAVEERDASLKMIERRNTEVERLQNDVNTLTKQLETAINSKCVALAEAEEVASMKLTLEYKEKRIEQERTLLNSQLETLSDDLNKRTEELLNMRRDNTSRCIQLESKLSEKTQELLVATERIKSLTDLNANLSAKAEELTQKLENQRELDAKANESFQRELEAQSKLTELYKNVSEDNMRHAAELQQAVSELQEVVRQATEQYGTLETKHKELELSNAEIIAKKNEYIEILKKELETASELIEAAKEQNLQNDIEGLCPAAATASKFIKSGMSLSEICSNHAATLEELANVKTEKQRLDNYIRHIIEEIEEKGPLLKRQREEFENALDTIEELTKKNEQAREEYLQLVDNSKQWKQAEGVLSRENERLNREVLDLSRQVCFLLQEVENYRVAGSSSTSTDQDLSDSMNSADIISKRLVTFSDIAELQSNNQRLLALVRELSAKQEEIESLDPAAVAKLKMKVESLEKEQADMLFQQEKHSKTMSVVISQRDMYKNLYTQAIKASGEEVPMQLERPYVLESQSQSSKIQDDAEEHPSDKVQDLEIKLEKAKNEIKTLKEENETYKTEKTANEKILIEQMESMRSELRELTTSNIKLSTKAEVNEERFKILQNNAEVYKNQINALEKQNKIYNGTIIKHENSISYLKDETLQTQTKLARAEVMLANLQKENALLKDAENRLLKEREMNRRKDHVENVLHTNIELIKAALERNDAESRIRLETRLDESYRECAALRRRLQEEQDRFRQLSNHLEKQAQTALEHMEEEKEQANKLRNELAEARNDLISKTVQIEELTKKLKNTAYSIPETNIETRKYRELEDKLEDSKAEIENLQARLDIATKTAEQQSDIAVNGDIQLKEVMNQFEKYREETDVKVQEQEIKIKQLEEKCSELQGEIDVEQDECTPERVRKLEKVHKDLNEANTELQKVQQELETTQNEVKKLQETLEDAENKYTKQMVLHSADLQSLTAIKEELTKAITEVEELKHARNQSVEALEQSRSSWELQEKLFKNEKAELEERLKNLDLQNTLLLDQIQALGTQISLVQTQVGSSEGYHNQSSGEGSFSKSFTEDDVKSSDQLLKIIKFLRQEKDISVQKCEILEAEHNRIKSQKDLVTKQLEEAKSALEMERQKSEVSVVTSAKHAEVLRKVETLNAITDSNRALRQERDALIVQINELKSRTKELEEQLAPLQEKNNELAIKAEAMQTENISLRAEATRWRQRANFLIEKSNRTSPEDWKKLQNERETLAKQLTIERSNVTKLNEDINNLKQDKIKLEEQLRSLRAQNNTQGEELMRLRDELNTMQLQMATLTEDLEKIQEERRHAVEENLTLNTDVSSKDGVILDLKNNLIQIRKIAKKYKTQCEEQLKELEVLKQQVKSKQTDEATLAEKQEQLRQEGRAESEERITQLERNYKEKLEELSVQLTSAHEETENYRKEIESVKQSSFEKEERFKALFKNAKERIVTLTEQNTNLKEELSSQERPSNDIQSEQTDDELRIEVERLRKEKEDVLTEKSQEKERLSIEIESLTQRINQLQRQLGLQQGSKPSTSSGPTEKSTTEPPTANIKPMSGHSTNTQTQSVPIQPWRSGNETPLASIRPMSMQLRTVAVLPTSQSPSAVMVPPQQQVHTTGSSNVEALSSSPTSSHTDYVPATSSASPAMLGLRQVAVPPTQSSQDNEDDDNNMQVQPATQQAVALVLPRVEPPSSCPAQEQGTSSSSSSNTVTTSQVGLKRVREDNDSCQTDDQGKQQQPKRTRIQQGETEAFQSVSESGLEVEYQVPTSSQRDHEEDADRVIVVESDDEGDGPDEGEGADDDEPDDADGEGYDMEGISYPEQELNYDDADCQDVEEEEEEGGNEVEVIEDSSEVPNQSEHSIQDVPLHEEVEQAQSEATSSGTNGTCGVTISQASTSISITMPSFSRTRPVAPLSRQQQTHLLLPHGLEEGGDDGIVPSTPTLYVPRRSDGFSEAVSSPHIPTSGRFTFSESAPPSSGSSNEIIPEQTLELANDDNSTGRSVPSTPLQASPQESALAGEEQSSQQSVQSEVEIPAASMSDASAEAEQAPEGSSVECMGPPSVAGTSTDPNQASEHLEEMLEGEDGVSSEGEKPPATEEALEEGREAEASPSTNTRSRSQSSRGNQSARRSVKHSHRGGMSRSQPTPIVWERASPRTHQDQRNTGRGGGSVQHVNYTPRGGRRGRGRGQRGPYTRY